jgi:hypothetical protein
VHRAYYVILRGRSQRDAAEIRGRIRQREKPDAISGGSGERFFRVDLIQHLNEQEREREVVSARSDGWTLHFKQQHPFPTPQSRGGREGGRFDG